MNRERIWPLLEGLLLAALVALVLAASGEAVRASYHGYLHVSVGEAVLREGLRPENPYHAGVALRYYTLYPLLGVTLGRLGNLGPLWAFVALNVLAALLLPVALDALGRRLRLGFAARRAAFWSMLLGFNGLGWIGYLFSAGDPFGSAPVYALMPMTFAREAWGFTRACRLSCRSSSTSPPTRSRCPSCCSRWLPAVRCSQPPRWASRWPSIRSSAAWPVCCWPGAKR